MRCWPAIRAIRSRWPIIAASSSKAIREQPFFLYFCTGDPHRAAVANEAAASAE